MGIDMAWRIQDRHTGIAVMVGDAREIRLTAVSCGITSMDGIFDFVAQQSGSATVIAIDASLVVKNASGQRRCETEIAVRFGKHHASCHSSNTSRLHHDTGMKLVARLQTLGFAHRFDLETARERAGKWLFEVYPHPAMVQLFGLQRIIRYKKGSVEQKREGLETLRTHLRNLADGTRGLTGSPVLEHLLEKHLPDLKGESLKRYEDTLDAVFCAYLAWHCWRWGGERNEMFGTIEDGYIVVPAAATPSLIAGEPRAPQPFGL